MRMSVSESIRIHIAEHGVDHVVSYQVQRWGRWAEMIRRVASSRRRAMLVALTMRQRARDGLCLACAATLREFEVEQYGATYCYECVYPRGMAAVLQ